MINNKKLIVDTFCEVYDLIKHAADEVFWDFEQHSVVPNSIYIVGRKQFINNSARLKELSDQNQIKLVLSNPHEGSTTLIGLCQQLGIVDRIQSGQILLIGGGNISSDLAPNHLQFDSFLPKLLDYSENQQAAAAVDEIYASVDKPYKFLFLNGRGRPHRKYLLERFMMSGLLEQSLWTNLDSNPGPHHSIYAIWENDQDRITMSRPFHYLPREYEVERYHTGLAAEKTGHYAKYDLFSNEWGEIYLKTAPYRDTYFSLVTETVFEHPWSFRTEKIWKPICIGHPWICAANRGYYADLRALGFRTFGHLIDESFDGIDDNVDRANRIVDIVEHICYNGAKEFMAAAEETCKYNQAQLAAASTQVRAEFPARFFQFINERFRL